jgi:hypothetical protein
VPSNGAPQGSLSPESAAFLRGEAPPGAEFTAGAPEVRSGGTQIAISPDAAPPRRDADVDVLATVTLPGTPMGVDRTMIAMDAPSSVDRTMIAADSAPVVRTDATVMLPGGDGRGRPPTPVDRTLMVTGEDMRPVSVRAPAEEAWSPARSGTTQPIAIDPSASSLARVVAQPQNLRVGLLVALIGVFMVAGLGVAIFFAWPHLRARLSAGGQDTSGENEAVADASASEGTGDVVAPAESASDTQPTTPQEPVVDAKTTEAPTPEEPTPEEPTPEEPTPEEPQPVEPTPVEPTTPDAKTPPEEPTPDAKTPPEEPTPDAKTPPEEPPEEPTPPKKPKTPKGKKKDPKKPKDPTVPEFKPGPFVPP